MRRDIELSRDDESSQGKPAALTPLPGMREAEPTPDQTKALEEMMPLVYEELRLLAGGYLRTSGRNILSNARHWSMRPTFVLPRKDESCGKIPLTFWQFLRV